MGTVPIYARVFAPAPVESQTAPRRRPRPVPCATRATRRSVVQPSYASGVSETPLIGQTIGDNLEDTVARIPDAEALASRHQDLRFTWRELNEQIDRVAKGLIASGLKPGDRLGMWSPNCVEWVLIQFATAKAGVILVNVNPAYRTTELRFALDQSGCRWLVAAKEFKTSDYAAMIDEVRPDV